MEVTKKTHPISRGWIHSTLTLYPGVVADEDEIKSLCSGKNPDDYTFALISQCGRKVKVVYREKPEVTKLRKLALITPVCRRASEMLKPLRAEACWHENDSRYYIEAWRDGEQLGCVWLSHNDLRQFDTQEPDEKEIAKQLADLLNQVT